MHRGESGYELILAPGAGLPSTVLAITAAGSRAALLGPRSTANLSRARADPAVGETARRGAPDRRQRRRLTAVPCMICAVGLLSSLVGCMAVGPRFTLPEPPARRTYTRSTMPSATAAAPVALGAAQSFVSAPYAEPAWWRAFNSQQLNTLVDRALTANPTLLVATDTLREAQQIYAARAGSTRYPTVNVNLAAAREEINGASVGQPQIPQQTYTLYNVGVAVNYNFDLFGGNRRALEALAAQADYANYELAGARLMLAANVVTTAFSQAQFAAQIDATRAMLAAERHQLDIARQDFALGTVSRVDLLALQTQVAQTRATLPPLRNRLEQADHLLAILVGRPPGAAAIPRFALTDFTLPARLPVVVPSALVRERPDVRASTALLHAATAQYGVAVAALYPDLNLSAELGTAALATDALFGPGSLIWSLAGKLAQPLFNAGLRAGAGAARTSMQAVGANYQQTVLQALRNVADILRQCQNDAASLQAQAAAYAAARRTLDIVQGQYRIGAASYLQLLSSDQQLQQIRIALVAAQTARLTDSAALYQAMGGGALQRTR